jgi:AcrR family transcriptional regulator
VSRDQHDRRPRRGEREKAPIWARPEPRGRGPSAPLSRAEIVRVAIKIADEEGIEAVSIRRIARELNSGAMSLYHYFDTRDELLELMGDTVAGEMLVAELPVVWRAALEMIARHSRAMFLAHPWMLAALQTIPAATPNLLRHIEQTARAIVPLAEAGLETALLNGIVTAVDDYTIGFTLRELSGGGRVERGRRFEARFADPNVRYLIESGEFPLLERFLASGAPAPQMDFEQGLAWLLDGFAARIDL